MSRNPAARVPNVESVDASKGAFRGPEVCALVGISYRQLDHWTRTGLVHPSIADAQGSGSQRLYSSEDVVVLRAIAQMLGIAGGHNARNDRLRIARIVQPMIREVLQHAGDDVLLVVFDTGAAVASTPDDLLDLLREHHSAYVLTVRGPDRHDTGAAA